MITSPYKRFRQRRASFRHDCATVESLLSSRLSNIPPLITTPRSRRCSVRIAPGSRLPEVGRPRTNARLRGPFGGSLLETRGADKSWLGDAVHGNRSPSQDYATKCGRCARLWHAVPTPTAFVSSKFAKRPFNLFRLNTNRITPLTAASRAINSWHDPTFLPLLVA